MSLTPEQRRRTAAELRANLELADLDEDRLARLTRWDAPRLAATLAVTGAAPLDVWRLRDLLEQQVLRVGRRPVPFTVLNESARAAARGWFGVPG